MPKTVGADAFRRSPAQRIHAGSAVDSSGGVSVTAYRGKSFQNDILSLPVSGRLFLRRGAERKIKTPFGSKIYKEVKKWLRSN